MGTKTTNTAAVYMDALFFIHRQASHELAALGVHNESVRRAVISGGKNPYRRKGIGNGVFIFGHETVFPITACITGDSVIHLRKRGICYQLIGAGAISSAGTSYLSARYPARYAVVKGTMVE